MGVDQDLGSAHESLDLAGWVVTVVPVPQFSGFRSVMLKRRRSIREDSNTQEYPGYSLLN